MICINIHKNRSIYQHQLNFRLVRRTTIKTLFKEVFRYFSIKEQVIIKIFCGSFDISLCKSEGVFYGMCSELCGVLHGLMPIVIESVSLESYLLWLSSQNSPLLSLNTWRHRYA
ncbi:hypothetical protein RclHR1_06680005 [Rhizophagus clarus]|uniref:Cytochrome oxidase subunit II copper A binding domain-containing protein n=1 Tax=Rhizophagus clarus TaxID=94130 RepID=A0A2Z6SJL4_9GLOM|nr:hypothetical protein RclHR1_06680005 [Rhizophagus clarus]